ncbi:MAG TPA: CvpA family protein [Pirellulaceae bacterium]|nr:CvpA family protein [Pirellulaceae bacterium]
MLQGYDLLMLIVLGAAIAWGAWKGFAWQIASLASVVLSYCVALNFRQPVAAIVSRSVEVKPPLDVFIAMLILFLGTSLVVWVVFNLVSEVIDKFKLKEFDHQVGAIFGMAKGVLLCVIITLFVVTLASETQRQSVFQSRSGYYIARLLDKANAVMPGELHQVIDPFVKKLEEGVVEPPRGEWSQRPAGDSPGWSFSGNEPAGSDDSDRAFERSLIDPPAGEPQPLAPLRRLPSDSWRR